jgi:V/A-type H+-transporting ATPase subunit E
MEEIRASDALENEIREDARRKAERILKQADRECQAMREEGTAKARAEAQAIRLEGEAAAEAYRREVSARMPLEMKRLRSSWMERCLRAELETAVRGLDLSTAEAFLLRRLEEAAASLVADKGAGPAKLRLRGNFSDEFARKASALLGGCHAERVEDAGTAEPALEAESGSGRVRFRASLASVLGELAEERRGDLAEALFGKGRDR